MPVPFSTLKARSTISIIKASEEAGGMLVMRGGRYNAAPDGSLPDWQQRCDEVDEAWSLCYALLAG